jgi:hypothetical protein
METIKERPKEKYSIFVVDDEDFDNLHKDLPYMTKEKLKDSLGFANPKTMEAYVRKTGVKELDDITLEHEFNELLAKTSPDEIDGIRYKKGGVARFIVPALLSLIPGVGPILAAVSNVGMSQYAKAGHPEQLGKPGNPLDIIGEAATGYFGGKALAGGVSGGIQGGTQAGAGFLSKAGGIVSGVAKGALAGSSGIQGNVLGNAPTGVVTGANNLTGAFNASQAANPALGQTANFGGGVVNLAREGGRLVATPISSGFGTGLALGAGASLLGKAPQITVNTPQGIAMPTTPLTPAPTGGLTSAFNQSVYANPLSTPTINAIAPTAGSGIAPAVEAAPKATWLSKLGKTIGDLATPQNILGGVMTLGSTMGKQPEYPEVDIESIRSSLLSGQGISPLGQQARTQLSQILTAKPGELYPTGTDAYYNAALRQTRLAYQRAQESLAKRYNMFDPNYQQNGEYQELARRLDTELANIETDYSVQEEQRRFELERTQKYQAIQQTLSVDDATMQDLIGLTGLSIQQAAAKFGVEVADVDEIRKALGGLGGELMASGMKSQTAGTTA